VTNTIDMGGDQQSLNVTNISGRWVGDGILPTGRGYSQKKGEGGKDSKDLLKNPVKGIRNLLGY